MADDEAAQESADPTDDDETKVDDPVAVYNLARKTDAENRKLKTERREATKELDRLRKLEKSVQSDQEKAIAVARDEARAEVVGEYETKLLRSAVAARAALVMADPSDSILLDVDGLVSDDAAAIDAALAVLLEAKPHLARANGDGRSSSSRKGIDQGPRGKVAGPGVQETSPDGWLRGELREKGLQA